MQEHEFGCDQLSPTTGIAAPWIARAAGEHRNSSTSASASGATHFLGSAFGMAPAPAVTSEPPKRLVRILGAAGFSSNRTSWRYLLETGEILTAAQIAGRYGLKVAEIAEDGVMRVIGEGIFYGPSGE